MKIKGCPRNYRKNCFGHMTGLQNTNYGQSEFRGHGYSLGLGFIKLFRKSMNSSKLRYSTLEIVV